MDRNKFTDKDIELIIACFKHTGTKPDFEKVAKELKITGKAAYFRHWTLMKKCGLSTSSAKGGKPAGRTASTLSGSGARKRVRSTKKESEEGLEDGDDTEEEPTPSKKPKVKSVTVKYGDTIFNTGGKDGEGVGQKK